MGRPIWIVFLDFTTKTRGRTPENTAHYIQDTTQDSTDVNCSKAETSSADKSAHSNILDPSPNGDGCNEKNDEAARVAHKNEYLAKLTPLRLFYLCSEDMQIQLKLRRPDAADLSPHDFAIAAQERRHQLGINASAWNEAVSEMTEAAATMAVIIVDARHSAGLVASPGGYLRGMTKKHRAGQLDIVGGLIGLSMLHH